MDFYEECIFLTQPLESSEFLPSPCELENSSVCTFVCTYRYECIIYMETTNGINQKLLENICSNEVIIWW